MYLVWQRFKTTGFIFNNNTPREQSFYNIILSFDTVILCFGTRVYHHGTMCREHSWTLYPLDLWPQYQNKKCFRNIYAPHGAKFWFIFSVEAKCLKQVSKGVDNTLGSRVVWPWPLNMWPENQKGSSNYWAQPLHQVWYWSNEGVKRYWADNTWSTNRPTDQPTDSCKTICPLFQGRHNYIFTMNLSLAKCL